ncbi:MAG TPA: FkbM family methyltransferase [Candidatus Nitrosocosmicus sp.]|nr:FkbM family methyltransferase [Candidatus Nitrosocosmicus sp.]
MGRLSSWLLKEPVGGIWPTADKCILFILKIFYLGVKVFFWIFLGKKRRDHSYTLMKIRSIINISPSLSSFRCLYKVRKTLGFSDTPLVKISVPKYGYRVYCPININKDDFINMTVREEEIIEHFRPCRGDIVVDIGAHIGRYTLIAAKRVSLNGKVIAIEANPDNFEMLNRNVKLNQLTNVTSLNYAVYSQETKIKLYLAGGGSGQTIYNTIMAERAKEGKEKFVEINANTLDHLMQLQGISEVNWIKIDVEGAELEVLKGAVNIISRSKDISLLIEIHNLAGSNSTLYEPITQFLNLHNFKIDFEKTYDGGEKHVIARKQQQQQ